MALSVVQSNKGIHLAADTSFSVTFTGGTTAGSTVLICVIQEQSGSMVANTPTGPTGFTHLSQVSEIVSGSGGLLDVWYKDNESGGVSSYTVSGLISSSNRDWFIYEIAGALTSSSADVSVPGSTTTGTSLSISSGTLAQAHEIVFAFFGHPAINSAVSTSGSPDASLAQFSASGGSLAEYSIVSATTSISLGATSTGSGKWVGLMVSLKQASVTTLQSVTVAGTKAVSQLKQAKLIKPVVASGVGRVVRRFNKAAQLVTGAPAVFLTKLKVTLALIFVALAASAKLGKTPGKLLGVARSSAVHQNKAIAKTVLLAGASAVHVIAGRLFAKTLSVAKAAVASVIPGFVRIKSLLCTGAPVAIVTGLRSMLIAFSAEGFANLFSNSVVLLFVSTQSNIVFGVLQHFLLRVVNAGASTLSVTRLRLINVALHPAVALDHLRAHLIKVLTPASAIFKVTVLKTLLATGIAATRLGPALIVKLLIAATGQARFIKMRLVRLKIVATYALNLNYVRAWLIQVLAVSNLALFPGQIHLVLIKALLVGQSLLVRKHVTKGIHVSRPGAIIIRVPRLLKILMQVAKTGLLSFLTRKGDPTLGHATRFTINASDDTRFKITNET